MIKKVTAKKGHVYDLSQNFISWGYGNFLKIPVIKKRPLEGNCFPRFKKMKPRVFFLTDALIGKKSE